MSRHLANNAGCFESLESRTLLAEIAGAVFVHATDTPQYDRQVYLDLNQNGQFDNEPTVKTDASGNYRFTGLGGGTYHVRMNVRPSLTVTAPADGVHIVTVGAEEIAEDLDFRIGHAYEQPVPDPNATIATAIPLGTLTDTVVVDEFYALNDDREMFSFTVGAGQTVRFEITSEGDHHLRIFDAEGNNLAGGGGGGPLELLTYTFTEAGTYYVGVSTSRNTLYDPHEPGGSMGWNNGFLGDYVLTVTPVTAGDQPGAGQWESAEVFGVHRIYGGVIEGAISTTNDVDLFRFGPIPGGGMGDTFGAKLIPQGDLRMYVKVYSSPGVLLYDYGPATADQPLSVPFSLLDGNHFVEVSSDGQTTGGYRINIYASLGVYDSDQSHFGAIDSGSFAGEPLNAREFIQYQGDVNVHRFELPANTPVKVRVAADAGATLDPKVRIFRVDDGQEILLAENDNVGPGRTAAEALVDYPPGGTIYVEVVDAAGTGIGDYTIEMTAAPQAPQNQAPTIGSLSASAGTVIQGQPLTLTASGVSDPDGDAIERITFFRDVNNNGLYDAGDERLGDDMDGSDGWSIAVNTSNLAPGTHRFFAFAFDGESWSTRTTTTVMIQPAGANPGEDPPAARGDFDGDGRPDLALVNTQTGQVRLWLMDNMNLKQVVELPTLADPNWRLVGTGDFNGDGHNDILWQHAIDNRNSVWLMNGTSLQGFKGIAYSPNLDWKVAVVGDFDGDGQPDLAWHNSANGLNSFWLMNGTSIKGFKGFGQTADLRWELGGAGYFDTDGNLHLAWSRPSVGGAATLWVMNRTQHDGFSPLHPILNVGDRIIGAGDFDGDGDDDILMRRSTGSLAVWRMDGWTPDHMITTLTDQPGANWQVRG